MKYISAICVMIVLVAGCTHRPDFDNLTIQEIKGAGYYAYILSNTYQTDLHWHYRIFMSSFDGHCDQYEYRWNPLIIFYSNKNNAQFQIYISYYPDPVFDDRNAMPITLDEDWIEGKKGYYYSDPIDGTYMINFHDNLGMEITISGRQTESELIEIISNLEYHGPNTKNVGNPWEKACD